MESIRERVVDLPTLAALRQQRQEREKVYVFRLSARELRSVSSLGDAPVVAYALICAAGWGARSGDWVTVPAISVDSVDRGYRWWHAATQQLAAAGLIEVERHRGRMPRYRLVSKKAASK